MPVVILTDSGSPHKFVNSNLANKVGLIDENNSKLDVMVVNGERLTSFGRSLLVKISLQGVDVKSALYILQLGGYDAVLGGHWLGPWGQSCGISTIFKCNLN